MNRKKSKTKRAIIYILLGIITTFLSMFFIFDVYTSREISGIREFIMLLILAFTTLLGLWLFEEGSNYLSKKIRRR